MTYIFNILSGLFFVGGLLAYTSQDVVQGNSAILIAMYLLIASIAWRSP